MVDTWPMLSSENNDQAFDWAMELRKEKSML